MKFDFREREKKIDTHNRQIDRYTDKERETERQRETGRDIWRNTEIESERKGDTNIRYIQINTHEWST